MTAYEYYRSTPIEKLGHKDVSYDRPQHQITGGVWFDYFTKEEFNAKLYDPYQHDPEFRAKWGKHHSLEDLKLELKRTEERVSFLKEEIKKISEILLVNDDINQYDPPGFKIVKGEKICKALSEGKLLKLKHRALGEFMVNMNPQRNRTQVSPTNAAVNEYTILNIVFMAAGDWYVVG